MALLIILFQLQEVQEAASWLSKITGADVIQLCVYLITITAFAVTLRERIKALAAQVVTLKSEAAELKAALTTHCDDEHVHLSERLYQEFMRRFDRLESKVDQRNQTPRSKR